MNLSSNATYIMQNNIQSILNDTMESKISFFLLAAFLIALPFEQFFSTIILCAYVIHTFIHLNKSRLSGLKKPSVRIICSIFFLNLIAVAYSAYPAEGLKNISHQLAIFFLPVCIAVSGFDFRKYTLPLLKIFAYTCTITIAYLYFSAFRTIYFFDFPISMIGHSTFLNHHFSEPIGLHATYLSMYVTLSIAIFFYTFPHKKKAGRGQYSLYITILIAGLIQLSSRSVFICLGLIILIAVPLFLLKGKARLYSFITALIAFTLIAGAILNFTPLKKRFVTDLQNDLTLNAVTTDFSETRMKRWNMALKLVAKSPAIGYGTGSERYLLKHDYFKNEFYKSYLLELNAHNQYLSFLINTGIIGTFMYLYILCFGFSKGYKKKNFLLISFFILISIVSLSENILNVNKGIFFYSFFSSLFLIPDSEKPVSSTKSEPQGNPLKGSTV